MTIVTAARAAWATSVPGSNRFAPAADGIAPEALSIEPHTLQCVPEYPVEENDLSGRRDDDPSGPDGAMSEAGCGVQGGERRQDLEQEPQRGVHSRRRCLVDGFAEALDNVRESIPGDELGNDDDGAGARVAFEAAWVRKPFVLERRGKFEALADRAFECAEFRPEMEPLEDAAGLPVEHEGSNAETVLVPGRRQRCGHGGWWH
jgi:hypothetical protein